MKTNLVLDNASKEQKLIITFDTSDEIAINALIHCFEFTEGESMLDTEGFKALIGSLKQLAHYQDYIKELKTSKDS